jgi:hypothetical protein
LRYQIVLYSHSGAVIEAFMVAQSDLSRLTMQIRDGEGFVQRPDLNDENYKLIPARSVGWADVARVAER